MIVTISSNKKLVVCLNNKIKKINFLMMISENLRHLTMINLKKMSQLIWILTNSLNLLKNKSQLKNKAMSSLILKMLILIICLNLNKILKIMIITGVLKIFNKNRNLLKVLIKILISLIYSTQTIMEIKIKI
jgi:hypothetical protein